MNQISRVHVGNIAPEPMPVSKPLQPSLQAVRQHQAQGRERTELTSVDAINSQAGVREGLDRGRRSLSQRAAALHPRHERYASPSRSRSRIGKAEKKEESFQDVNWLAPVHDALDLLSRDDAETGKRELEAHLSRHFEPLQRYHVLFEALLALEKQDLPPRKKKSMRRTFNSMMTALVDGFPHEVRKALLETDDLASAVEAMSEDSPVSVRDLRFLIGAKKNGNVDMPLTPLTMLRALIKNFGSDHCVQAMGTLRSRMMSGL